MEESSSNQEDFINNRDEMKIQSTEEREEGYDSDPNSENNDNNDAVVETGGDSDDVNMPDQADVVVVQVVVDDHNQQNLDEKNCWVCFASEEDDPSASWTHPCK